MNAVMKVVVLSADLMDRSKISATYPDATLVRSCDQLEDHALTADVMLVDLNRLDDMALLRRLVEVDIRVVAFGSHVDEALLVDAVVAGAEALPRSVFFRRIADGSI